MPPIDLEDYPHILQLLKAKNVGEIGNELFKDNYSLEAMTVEDFQELSEIALTSKDELAKATLKEWAENAALKSKLQAAAITDGQVAEFVKSVLTPQQEQQKPPSPRHRSGLSPQEPQKATLNEIRAHIASLTGEDAQKFLSEYQKSNQLSPSNIQSLPLDSFQTTLNDMLKPLGLSEEKKDEISEMFDKLKIAEKRNFLTGLRSEIQAEQQTLSQKILINPSPQPTAQTEKSEYYQWIVSHFENGGGDFDSKSIKGWFLDVDIKNILTDKDEREQLRIIAQKNTNFIAVLDALDAYHADPNAENADQTLRKALEDLKNNIEQAEIARPPQVLDSSEAAQPTQAQKKVEDEIAGSYIGVKKDITAEDIQALFLTDGGDPSQLLIAQQVSSLLDEVEEEKENYPNLHAILKALKDYHDVNPKPTNAEEQLKQQISQIANPAATQSTQLTAIQGNLAQQQQNMPKPNGTQGQPLSFKGSTLQRPNTTIKSRSMTNTDKPIPDEDFKKLINSVIKEMKLKPTDYKWADARHFEIPTRDVKIQHRSDNTVSTELPNDFNQLKEVFPAILKAHKGVGMTDLELNGPEKNVNYMAQECLRQGIEPKVSPDFLKQHGYKSNQEFITEMRKSLGEKQSIEREQPANTGLDEDDDEEVDLEAEGGEVDLEADGSTLDGVQPGTEDGDNSPDSTKSRGARIK